MKQVALIPVRAKAPADVPNKNVLMLEGKLVAGYTIEAALASACFAKVVVLTDKLEYQDALSRYPIDIYLCSEDELATQQSLITAWENLEPLADEFAVCAILAPETPLRSALQIQQCCQFFAQATANYLYSTNPHGQENGAIYLRRLPSALLPGDDIVTYSLDKAGSLWIDDGFEYELVKALLQLKVKYQTSLLNVQRRIREKLPDFAQTKPITLIGHSLWDYWNIENLADLPVNNLGIGAITTQQYVELILQQHLVRGLGKYTLIYLGINEMCRAGWRAEDTLYWLNETVNALRKINPETQIYLLEVSYMAFKRDISNAEIDQFNHQLRRYFADKPVTLIAPNSVLQDGYRKLDLAFTDDGLHFNQAGYAQLEQLLQQALAHAAPAVS